MDKNELMYWKCNRCQIDVVAEERNISLQDNVFWNIVKELHHTIITHLFPSLDFFIIIGNLRSWC